MTNEEMTAALKAAQGDPSIQVQPTQGLPMSMQGVDQMAAAGANQYMQAQMVKDRQAAAIIQSNMAEAATTARLAAKMEEVGQRKLQQKASSPQEIKVWTDKISCGFFAKRNWRKQVRGMVEQHGIPGPNKLPDVWQEAYEQVEDSVRDPDGVVAPIIAHLHSFGKSWSPTNLAVVVGFMLMVSNLTAILLRDGSTMIDDPKE